MIKETVSTQFGFKSKSSCNHAIFVLTEAIDYFRSKGTPIHLVSLDATKAFDHVWLDGLFFKLKHKIDTNILKIIINYYDNAKGVVKKDSEFSELFNINTGVKQGGILSPYLFNFYINDMIKICIEKNIGAQIKQHNVSTIGYCDDVLLLGHLLKDVQSLVKICEEYGRKWRISFNEKK